MDQEKFAALIKLIMSDKRIMDLINHETSEICECCDLTLIETKGIFESLPFEWREKVYCQEFRDGGEGFLSYDAAAKKEWKKIRVYQPSLNILAKLALGIADESLLSFIQEKLIEGAENIELVRLCNLSKVKSDSYKKLFLGYVEKIKSFGIKIDDGGSSAVKTAGAACTEKKDANIWQYKALTERDLLDIEKGTILTVGKKCIITSLAVDMARRKSIQICREGEVI